MIKIQRKQITSLLSDIQPLKTLPSKTANCIHVNIINNLTEQLIGKSIDTRCLPELKRILTRSYYKCLAPYGEAVGVLCAQSLGEKQTQSTLNTFHQAGNAIATVITGVPRFRELLDATKNQKATLTTIYLKDDYKTIKDIKNVFAHSIVQITFDQLLNSYQMYKQTPQTTYKINLNCLFNVQKKIITPILWISLYLDIYDINIPIETQYYMICTLNKHILYQYKIPLDYICNRINSIYSDIYAIPSPPSEHSIAIFINTEEAKQCFSKMKHQSYIAPNNMPYIYMEDVILNELKSKILCGIPNIKNMFLKQQQNKWIMETQGSNLVDVFRNSLINPIQTICNDVWEIYKVLGIEAAREFLIREFQSITSSDGSYINMRHITVIVDFMTYHGDIRSISRYGMKKTLSGPLTKASFEECLDNFIKAGVYTDIERVNGVSSSIMCANPIQIGTGFHSLIFKHK